MYNTPLHSQTLRECSCLGPVSDGTQENTLACHRETSKHVLSLLILVHVQHLTIVGIKVTVIRIIKAAAISDFVLRKYQARWEHLQVGSPFTLTPSSPTANATHMGGEREAHRG